MTRFLVLLTAVAAGGCGIGVTHRYDDVTPEVVYRVRGKIAVAVHDRRSDVVSGRKLENFAGLSRVRFGIPFNVTTESGQPLAKEFQNSLAAALERAGARVVRVDLKPATPPDEARRQLLSAGADKSVLLTLREWRADTYVNVNLDHDVVLVILGPRGQTLAMRELNGEERIGRSMLNPAGTSKEVVPAAYRRKLEALLATPAVADALR